MFDALVATGKGESNVEAKAWRVDFNPSADVESEKIAIDEPRRIVAALTEVQPADVLCGAVICDHQSLTVLWLPSDANVPLDREREAEAWARADADGCGSAPIRAGIRTVRVFWNVDRALICSSPETLSAALDAVVRFTVLQRDTLALESTMAATWPEIDADASLAHSVVSQQQARQQHVDTMTEATVRMLASHMRLTRAVEQFDRSLDESSKRIFAELTLAAGVSDRLELLEDPLYFARELYESANTRLIEARNVAKEHSHAVITFLLEATIIVALIYPMRLFW